MIILCGQAEVSPARCVYSSDPDPGFTGGFDWVWEHTCFCAISPSLRQAYARAVASALRPGGEFLAVFYLDPGYSSPDEGPPFGVSKEELDKNSIDLALRDGCAHLLIPLNK